MHELILFLISLSCFTVVLELNPLIDTLSIVVFLLSVLFFLNVVSAGHTELDPPSIMLIATVVFGLLSGLAIAAPVEGSKSAMPSTSFHTNTETLVTSNLQCITPSNSASANISLPGSTLRLETTYTLNAPTLVQPFAPAVDVTPSPSRSTTTTTTEAITGSLPGEDALATPMLTLTPISLTSTDRDVSYIAPASSLPTTLSESSSTSHDSERWEGTRVGRVEGTRTSTSPVHGGVTCTEGVTTIIGIYVTFYSGTGAAMTAMLE